jgi:hypothetical protein
MKYVVHREVNRDQSRSGIPCRQAGPECIDYRLCLTQSTVALLLLSLHHLVPCFFGHGALYHCQS